MLEEIKTYLGETSAEDVRLYFIIRKKNKEKTDKETIEKIDYKVFRTEITTEIGKTFLEFGKRKIDSFLETEDLQYKEYSPGSYLEKNHIETIPKEEVQFLEKVLQDMAIANLDLFDMNQSKNLWAYAIKIGNSGITLFRKYTENRILDKKGWISLFVQEGKFNQLKESILTIDEDIDCIYYDEKIYILNIIQFERIFSFMDKFVEEINANITALEEKSIVDDTSSLWNLCKSDPRKVKKFYKVLKGDILTDLDLNKINQLNTQYSLNLNFADDGKILVNRESIWTILKVLDDDYLNSPVTANKYEAQSKVKKT